MINFHAYNQIHHLNKHESLNVSQIANELQLDEKTGRVIRNMAIPWNGLNILAFGEDEAGGYPSRYLGQFGLESTGTMGERWSYRWFGEFAATSCGFWKSDEIFNCAYNHGIYETG